jgi:hypothetical protein
MIYALIVGGQLHATYSTEPECEMAANRMASEQYQAITSWAGGKSVKNEGGEWRVVLDKQIVFRVACAEKQQLSNDERLLAEMGNAQRENEERRAELFAALKHRVLTDDEMREVLNYGEMINTPMNVSYNSEEKARERSEAFQRQILLRSMQPR